MNKISLKKTGIVALVAVFVIAVIIPNVAFASTTAFSQDETVQVTAYARGIAIQKIDNGTVKMPANLTLTAEPINRGEKLITFKIVGAKSTSMA